MRERKNGRGTDGRVRMELTFSVGFDNLNSTKGHYRGFLSAMISCCQEQFGELKMPALHQKIFVHSKTVKVCLEAIILLIG
jgi:hypothetical protein